MRVCEGYVDALVPPISPCSRVSEADTYAVKCGTVLRNFNDLDGRVVAHVHGDVGRQRHLKQADRAGVHVVAGAVDGEHGHHVVRHVERLGAQTQVDVHERSLVSGEPSRLPANCAAGHRPLRAVS